MVKCFFTFGLFILGSSWLVFQDLKSLSVSSFSIIVVGVCWVCLGLFFSVAPQERCAISASILIVGSGILLIRPGSLGEADIIYASALAWLLPFWSFLFSIGIACLLGLIAITWFSNWGRRSVFDLSLPFLPCLALGAFGAWSGLI